MDWKELIGVVVCGAVGAVLVLWLVTDTAAVDAWLCGVYPWCR